MTTSVIWPAKDPRDDAWYEIPLGFVATALEDGPAVVLDSGVIDFTSIATWPTPGDDISTYTQVPEVSELQLATDGRSVKMRIRYGKPLRNYAVSVGVVTTDGSTVFASAILPILGR